MKKIIVFLLPLIVFFQNVYSDEINSSERLSIDLSGKWQLQLDPNEIGESEKWFQQTLVSEIFLPGSLAEYGFGYDPENYDAIIGPIPKKEYVGSAWYQKDITLPEQWKKKYVTLFIERARWRTTVWINGTLIGTENSLGTPHEYEVSEALKPGVNRITICVNNNPPFSLGGISSTNSPGTQGNWNGIIGRLELIGRDYVWLDEIQTYPNIKNGTIRIRATVGNKTGSKINGVFKVNSISPDGESAGAAFTAFEIEDKKADIEMILKLNTPIALWSEFTPQLYKLECLVSTESTMDSRTLEIGMREISHTKKNILVNGKPVYIRGTLECANFPLTGYPSMNLADWMNIMTIIKSNGLNQIRFHSWTPPEAAFIAADRIGLYLQPEAPRANIENAPARDAFIQREMLRINHYYGNHPSFVLFSSGNELIGFSDINTLLPTLHADDSRHLYNFSSGGRGMVMAPSGDITLENFEIGGLRGFPYILPRMGHDNAHTYYRHNLTPRNDHDLGDCGNRGVPIIAHELGQWSVFPSMAEIEKYTGAMIPVNLILIRNEMKKKGLLEQANDFTRVTASHAAVLYREEIETMMRSPGSAGFSLLQLNDYSGQGTAHVGLYNGFWENKGGITPHEFQKFCSASVPLLRTAKYVYKNDELFEAKAELFHYGEAEIKDAEPYWEIRDMNGNIINSGKWENKDIPLGCNTELGSIQANLSNVKDANKLIVEIGLRDTDILNSWNIWVYPSELKMEIPDGMIICRRLTLRTIKMLETGSSVILVPEYKSHKKLLRGRFVPPFWSPVWGWTRKHRGNVSMSILCNPSHPALKQFPTEEFSNWQWANLLDSSVSIIMDDLPTSLNPIVQVVDNFSRNHKFGATPCSTSTKIQFDQIHGKF